ncbi:MAG: catalytic protein of component of various dehydrogenase complexe [Gemmataceae bacterium]|nr:catalytic protein of component of various dehydrogenase complexe [Gemmataceae bacterium]
MDFPLPPVGEGLYEVELVRWLVRPGDAVGRGQGLMEVMSDKATMEVPAPFAGTVTGLSAAPGTKVQVGQVVLSYTPVGEPVVAGGGHEPLDPSPPPRPDTHSPRGGLTPPARHDHPPPPHANGHPTPALPPGRLPPAAPSVRMLARKLGIDLTGVRGTGPHGRILLDDLSPFLKPVAGSPPPAQAAPDAPKLDLGVAGTRVKLVGLRRKIAEHMVASKRHIPHYSYIDECDLTDLVRLRAQLREPFEKAGVKLTYLAFLVKAVARALKEVPVVNSTLDETAGEIVLHDRYHVGVAVATPGGLIVPVVKDADKKDLAAVAAEIDRLSADARAGRSRLDNLKGGTFTVTSIGGIGGLISTPIINHPEVGIMGVGKVVKRPVYDDAGKIRPADVVYLSFSFDHRVVDGAVGAAFGNAVVKHLRNPATLLLPEKFGG